MKLYLFLVLKGFLNKILLIALFLGVSGLNLLSATALCQCNGSGHITHFLILLIGNLEEINNYSLPPSEVRSVRLVAGISACLCDTTESTQRTL